MFHFLKKNIPVLIISILSMIFILRSVSLILEVKEIQADLRNKVNIITIFGKLEKEINRHEQDEIYHLFSIHEIDEDRNSTFSDFEQIKRELYDIDSQERSLSSFLDSINLETLTSSEIGHIAINDSLKKEIAYRIISSNTRNIDRIKNKVGYFRAQMGEYAEGLNDKWKLINILVIVSCLLALLLVVLFYFLFKNLTLVNSQKEEISLQNEEIRAQSDELCNKNEELAMKNSLVNGKVTTVKLTI